MRKETRSTTKKNVSSFEQFYELLPMDSGFRPWDAAGAANVLVIPRRPVRRLAAHSAAILASPLPLSARTPTKRQRQKTLVIDVVPRNQDMEKNRTRVRF